MKKRFTLMELIIVIVVIGILAAIILLNIKDIRGQAEASAIKGNIKNMQTAIDMYRQKNNGLCPAIIEPTIGKPQPIDIMKLYPDYLRSLPETSTAHYWVDHNCQVYGSTSELPVVTSKDNSSISFTPPENSQKCNLYYSNGGYYKLETRNISSPHSLSENKDYYISCEDENELETPPVGEGGNSGDGGDGGSPNEGGPLKECNADGYICIYTKEDLDNVRTNLSGKYRLANNIDISSYSNWDSIGDISNPFTGILDGNGLTISNLTISNPEFTIGDGLFAYSSGSLFENINLTNVSIKSGSYTGALVGNAHTTMIKNTAISGQIEGAKEYVGGIVGHMEGTMTVASLIDKSTMNGSVSLKEYDWNGWGVGSLLGEGIRNVTISNSYSTGDVTGVQAVGGLVGSIYSQGDCDWCAADSINVFIKSSNSSAVVSGSGEYIYFLGGVAGYGDQVDISNSYSTGDITATITSSSGYANEIGGFIGEFVSEAIISNSYSTGDVTINSVGGSVYDIGGFAGYAEEVEILNSYSSGNVTINGSVGSRNVEVGGFAGLTEWSTVSNSYSTGTVNATQMNYVGGFTGFSENNSMLRNYSASNVVGNNYVGGFAGNVDYIKTNATNYQGGTENPILEPKLWSNNYASGNVTGKEAVGGFAGLYLDSDVFAYGSPQQDPAPTYKNMTIKNSFATGNVTGTNYVGGFIGKSYQLRMRPYSNPLTATVTYHFENNTFENTYSTGKVAGSSNVGGYSGEANTHNIFQVISSYWDKDTSGQSSSPLGIGKTTFEMKNQSTYSGWDFVNTWIMNGSNYPRLR